MDRAQRNPSCFGDWDDGFRSALPILRSNFVGCFRRAEILSQCRLMDFPRGVARQGVDELDQARTFEPRQIGLAVRMDLLWPERMAGLARHDRHADFMPLLVQDTYLGSFGDCRELM